jgi:hypothetical protein
MVLFQLAAICEMIADSSLIICFQLNSYSMRFIGFLQLIGANAYQLIKRFVLKKK